MRPAFLAQAPLALALLACVATFDAQAQVYKWKDARGATHYTQAPPPKGSYSEKAIRKGPAAPAATPAAPAEPATCATARKNAALLKGTGPVQMDSDGDGKPDKTLDDATRANQLAYAEAALRANNCVATPAATAAK